MANWRKELKELIRRFPTTGIETDDIAKALYEGESDRGCALIAGAVAENALESIIRVHLVPMSKTKLDELFAAEGVLSSFSAKIKIAFALGFIDPPLRDHFDKMREIRNAFAHAKIAIDFKNPIIRRACVGLLDSKDGKKIEPRALYTNSCYLLMHACGMVLERHNKGALRRPVETERGFLFSGPRPTISYNEALASFEKSFRQFQQQLRSSPPLESKKITRKGRPPPSRE